MHLEGAQGLMESAWVEAGAQTITGPSISSKSWDAGAGRGICTCCTIHGSQRLGIEAPNITFSLKLAGLCNHLFSPLHTLGQKSCFGSCSVAIDGGHS